MPRVAAIVIDAAEWGYLERLIGEGHLPNLAALRARGAYARIDTPVAFRSELVWARFLHGVEPLEEREWPVCVTFDPATYRTGTNTASRRHPFFALGDGTKVVTLDLIHHAPSDAVAGIQVVGWGSHSPMWPRQSRPVGLLTEIDGRFGVNPAFGNDFAYGWHQPAFVEALRVSCETGAGRRVDIASWLLTERLPDWDLFVTCISELHSVGHQLWHGVDPRHPLFGLAPTTDLAGAAMASVAAVVDEQLGRLLAVLGDDTTVLVCSFHGFQPGDDVAATVLLPELFQRLHTGRGLLADPDQVAWRANGCPPVIPADDEHIGSYYVDRFADSARQRLRRAVRRVVPRRAFEDARRLFRRPDVDAPAAMSRSTPPETLLANDEVLAEYEQDPSYQVATWYRRHWPSMRYFALPTFADGHVRVNLAGREAAGTVPAAEYSAVLDEIEELLGACRDARTGAPIVDQLVRVRADDPFAVDGPDADLLVVFAGAPDAIEHPVAGTIGPHPHLRTAHHSPDGFAFVAGPGIAPTDLGRRPAIDLPATVLTLLGKEHALPGISLVPESARR